MKRQLKKINRSKAIYAQRLLSRRVSTSSPFKEREIKYVAGLDVSYAGNVGVAALVIMKYPSLKLHSIKVLSDIVSIPYIPTFLAYREIPLYVKLCFSFRSRRDIVFLVDGHGLTHPRKLGIASHLGVVLDLITIGVAKKFLYGTYIGKEYIAVDGVPVAKVISSSPDDRKIFISIGNNISLQNAIKIAEKCIVRKSLLPEPIRIADDVSRRVARKIRR